MPVELSYEDRLRRALGELETERESFRKKATLVDLLEVTALAASAATSVVGLLQFILERLCLRLGWQIGQVWFPSTDGSMELRQSTIVYCEEIDRFGPFLEASQAVRIVRGVDFAGRVWEKCQPEWMEDLLAGKDFKRENIATCCGLISGLAWPVMHGRLVVAVVEMYSDRLQPVDDTLMRTLIKVGSQLGRMMERQRMGEVLRDSMAELDKRVETSTLELQYSNQRLQQKIGEYEKAEKLKDDLVSTVSHELRTPLASMRGFTELMLSRQFPLEQQEKFLGIVHKELLRMSTLVNDFLDVQRLETGRVNFNLEAVSLEPLLDDAMTLINAGEAGGRIRVSVESGLPEVRIDVGRIRQVIANLIGNAIKFSPNGGDIMLGAVRDGKWVTIFVSDNGIGVDNSAIDHLFEKFYRADTADTRSIGGPGLGLALVKEIVEAHKGVAWAESNPGEGTVFFVNLPVADELAGGYEGRRVGVIDVLLVEEDPDYVEEITRHLEKAGLTVLSTASTAEALSWLHHTKTGLVLLDTHLAAEMDGWDLANSMKQDPFLRFIPVVNISASETRAGGILLDGCLFLSLPATPELLLSTLRKALGRKLSGKVLLGMTSNATVHQLTTWLDQFGKFEIQQATSPVAVLAEVEKRIPDLLIMELQLDDQNSIGVMNALRNNRQTANLAVVVLGNREILPHEEACLNRRLVHSMRKDHHSPAAISERTIALLSQTRRAAPAQSCEHSDLICVSQE